MMSMSALKKTRFAQNETLEPFSNIMLFAILLEAFEKFPLLEKP